MRTKPNPDITGQRFGRLLAVAWKQSPKKRGFIWTCKCDCGCEIDVRADGLKSGHCKSCGCLKRDLLVSRQIHGASNTITYNSWISMISRCNNPDNSNFPNYGGRGIKVCEAWLNFNSFVNDVGYRPSLEHTIDRINNSGNYEPGNVRWATHVQQSNNKRTNRMVNICGDSMTATQAARIFGMRPWLVLNRLESGWETEKALFLPARPPTNPKGINGTKVRKPKVAPAPEPSLPGVA